MNNNAAAQGGGGKMMNFGKNRAKLTTQEENHIKFSDVRPKGGKRRRL